MVDRLRPRLRSFRDENGKELLDVPDGALPAPDTPAPPRFLPEYDNIGLSHADRSRLFAGLGPGGSLPRAKWKGTVLVDGFYRAKWGAVVEDGVATLTLHGLAPLEAAVEEEALGLLRLIAPDARPQVEWRG